MHPLAFKRRTRHGIYWKGCFDWGTASACEPCGTWVARVHWALATEGLRCPIRRGHQPLGAHWHTAVRPASGRGPKLQFAGRSSLPPWGTWCLSSTGTAHGASAQDAALRRESHARRFRPPARAWRAGDASVGGDGACSTSEQRSRPEHTDESNVRGARSLSLGLAKDSEGRPSSA